MNDRLHNQDFVLEAYGQLAAARLLFADYFDGKLFFGLAIFQLIDDSKASLLVWGGVLFKKTKKMLIESFKWDALFTWPSFLPISYFLNISSSSSMRL